MSTSCFLPCTRSVPLKMADLAAIAEAPRLRTKLATSFAARGSSPENKIGRFMRGPRPDGLHL